MRRSIRIALGFLALVMCTLVTLQLRDRMRTPELPERLPHDWTRAAAPGAWIFVRPGCGHCEAHLRALDRATRQLDPSRRHRVLDRVRVVGSSPAIPAGVHTEPDSLRRILDVRTTPTTLLVDAGGRILEVWRGARGIRAWEHAIDVVDVGKEP